MLDWILTILFWLVVTAIALMVVVATVFKIFIAGFPRRCTSQASMKGKTVIVTGANTGIGKETALDLASRGARVICACRSQQRGQEAVSDIQERCGHKNVVFEQLDLADFNSIREFAARLIKQEPRLDVLVNNAGLVTLNRQQRTKQGHELTFGVNHLGPFLLTYLLLDLLKASAPSRIVNVSSMAHRMFKVKHGMKLDRAAGFYRDLGGYEASKFGNIMHARELTNCLRGTGVTANSLHPGGVASNMPRHYVEQSPWYVAAFVTHVLTPLMWTNKEGAQTSIYCAIDESLETVSGKYFDNCAVHKESKLAQSDALAWQFWNISMELCGLK